MRKNWLAAGWTHWFRPAALVPHDAFQDAADPYPGHWRRFPQSWPVTDLGTDPVGPTADDGHVAGEARVLQISVLVEAALAELPGLWRRVVLARGLARGDDRQVAAQLSLTLEQERDILARARAAVRDRLDRARTGGPR